MKQHFFFGCVILLLLLFMPLIGLGGQLGQAFVSQPEQTAPHNVTEQAPKQNPAKPIKDVSTASEPEVIAVMRSASGSTEVMQMDEYLLGVVAAEMPASAHEEALKAQAVASYTYARYRTEIAGVAALSDSGKLEQEYIAQDERRRRWGDNFDLYESKLRGVVAAVQGEVVTYDSQPIFAAFHAVSHGKTESAASYWGGTDHPYLRSTESPGDRLAPNYAKTVHFTPDEMKKAIEKAEKEKGYKFALDGGPSGWFGKPTRSETGMVQEIEVAGLTLSGRALRELLDLRSADFTIDFAENSFAVTTRGYGHGVGMSQYGADFMARQGSGYKEILEHYYAGTRIENTYSALDAGARK